MYVHVCMYIYVYVSEVTEQHLIQYLKNARIYMCIYIHICTYDVEEISC
jgi:hypothetical protein